MKNAAVLSIGLVLTWALLLAGCRPDRGEHTASPTPSAAPTQAMYTCPMHPEVVSPDAGAKCPKCGMALVKKAD